MDIQEEREAFEAWYCRNHTGLKQSDLAKFRTLSGYSFSDSLKINISWEAWQAAKAQAVPEGYAVVPVEPKQETIKQMNKVWFESNCAHIMKTKTAELLYKAMIEAQEQK